MAALFYGREIERKEEIRPTRRPEPPRKISTATHGGVVA
jgi:hypothetical protein